MNPSNSPAERIRPWWIDPVTNGHMAAPQPALRCTAHRTTPAGPASTAVPTNETSSDPTRSRQHLPATGTVGHHASIFADQRRRLRHLRWPVRALEGADRGIVEPRAERHREPPRVDDREQRVEMPRQQPARQHGERALAERAEESSDLDGHDAGGARPVPPREYRAAFSYAVAVEEPPPSRRHRTAAHAARWPDCLDRGRLDADRWLTVREIDKVHPLDSQNPSTRRGLRAARPGPPPRPFQAAGMAMPRSPATAPSRPAPP
jgi:hypothetical protein